ncbi:MAG TPA: hypothetical protein DGG94_04310 [Micromonosporaceae bacterium]|nr:hypothetical protein [Micromonosporaceae bacterium]HCU49022.1 hypothetical protein [Micromonosporaceae bacterium]
MPSQADLHRIVLVEVLTTSRNAWYCSEPVPGKALAAVEDDTARQLVRLCQQLPESDPCAASCLVTGSSADAK